MKIKVVVLSILIASLLIGCQERSKPLKIAATSVPHAEMLEVAKEELSKNGVVLKIIIVDDYNIPNRLLSEGEVDANFFQHTPFLEEQKKQFGFDIEVLERVHLEPLGIYSKCIKDLKDLKEKALVAIPNDPTNEARALLLLQKEGLIELRPSAGFNATPLDILSNPLRLRFKELDASFLARTLEDVDIGVIPANFALSVSLFPLKDALALESAENSPYANIVAIRKGSGNERRLLLLKRELTSNKMRQFILERYQGEIYPAFN